MSNRSLRMAFLALAVIVGLSSSGWAARHTPANSNNPPQKPPPTPPEQTEPPASQPSTASQDKAAEATAQSGLDQAKQALQDLTDQKWAAFQQTPDWSTAQTRLDGIKADIDAAKKTAADSLTSNPDYQAALADKQKAEDAITALRADGNATTQTLAPLANASLQASIKIRQLQSDLIANDPAIQAATDKLAAAQRDLDLLKMKFQNGLSADKQYAAARSAVDVAQRQYDDAHAKVASSSGN